MAKRVKIDDGAIASIMEDFGRWIRGLTTFDKATYQPKFAKVESKATLFFTETAWAKMQYLVAAYDSEVAWHGTVKRVEAGKSDFVVTDIFVYPQEVTGATVNTDQKGYQDWMYGTEDDPDSGLPDEIFNNLKFHGHSHVNMATSPSTTDLDHQQSLVAQLDSSMFYVFVIWNKSNQRTVMIYDMAANTLFENSDVDVKVIQDDSVGFLKLMDDAKKMISKKSWSYQSGYGYGSTYGAKTTASTKSSAKPTLTKSGKSSVQAASAAVSPEPKAGVRADGIDSGYHYANGAWCYGYDEYY